MKLDFNREIAMTLHITMKPKRVEKVFESAFLHTENNAKVTFKKSAYSSPFDVKMVLGESTYFWDVEALLELANACLQIAHILNQQND